MGTPKIIRQLTPLAIPLVGTDLIPGSHASPDTGDAFSLTLTQIAAFVGFALESGLSVDPVLHQGVLGNALGATIGKLLQDTEIPLNNFLLLNSGIGQSAGKHLVFKYNAAAPANGEPFFEFQKSDGTTWAKILFDKTFGDLSIVIGNNNGLPGNRGVKIIGENILGNPGTSRDLTLIGQGILATAPAEAQEKIVVIGSDSLDVGGAFGSYITIVGNDVFDGMGADVIGSNIKAIGNFINNASYPGGGLGSHIIIIGDNIGVGGAATDVTIIGDGFVTSLSHIFLLGTPTQNVIVGGALTGETDNGAKLQVRGNAATQGRRKAHRSYPAVGTATFGKNDENLLVDTTAGNVVISIDPTIDGIEGTVKKVSSDANSVTLTPASGTIQVFGAPVASYAFNVQGESVTFFSDGTNLYVK